jgi:MscS family membrane protein
MVFLARAAKTESKTDDQLVPFLRDILKIFVYIILFLAFLSQIFQINIAALVAGLGVGGIAIALASKDSLENLLGSFTIFLDKPFAVGDLVNIDGITGTIERVGIRSTRIRTLDKSYVTVPNKKLTESNLDNLTLRSQRRARFYVGLTYNTHPDQVRAIVQDIRTLLDEHPQTSMDGVAHFYEFGESSLSIMVQYFVNSMDWNVYMLVREEINFQIMDIVHRHGCQFAYPTRSIYLENNFNQQP